MLTKSLHTVTAVANMAACIARYHDAVQFTPEALCADALAALGYPDAFALSDPTVARCVAACAKVLS
jgi:hypothetical protein